MFWTMMPTEADPHQSVTLCEHHALEETNSALDLVEFGGEFGSMVEAAAVLAALVAFGGGDLGMVSHETGECALCESEADVESDAA